VLDKIESEKVKKRASAMIPGYEKMFAERGGITPSDPLEFHLYHLARYWSRLVGFCRQDPSKSEVWIDGDLGACVEVGSEFAHRLIEPTHPIYKQWQEYWIHTQAMLHERPVTIEAVEAASRSFNVCVAELKYDPWA
jgi:hypothetical protein